MRDYIEERAISIANYMIEQGATVRQAAKEFGISKSTVHKDCQQRLLFINPALAKEVRKVLEKTRPSATYAAAWPQEKNIYITNKTHKKGDARYCYRAEL